MQINADCNSFLHLTMCRVNRSLPYSSLQSQKCCFTAVCASFSLFFVVKSYPSCSMTLQTDDYSHKKQTRSSQRQHGQAVATLTFRRVKISLGGVRNIDRIPLVKCALRIPEIWSEMKPFPSRHEPLDVMAKKKKKKRKTALLLWNYSSCTPPPPPLLLSGRGCAAGSGWARWRQPFVITFNTCLCRWEHSPMSLY